MRRFHIFFLVSRFLKCILNFTLPCYPSAGPLLAWGCGLDGAGPCWGRGLGWGWLLVKLGPPIYTPTLYKGKSRLPSGGSQQRRLLLCGAVEGGGRGDLGEGTSVQASSAGRKGGNQALWILCVLETTSGRVLPSDHSWSCGQPSPGRRARK